MKTIILFLCLIASMGFAMSLLKENGVSTVPDFQQVVETNVGGVDYIADEIVSPSHNKIKLQYTTFSGDIPAFDLVMDFTAGKMLQYLNLTGECNVYDIAQMDLGAYLEDLMTNHVEFAGTRGEHLHLYEIKHPEEPGARTWIYGFMVDNDFVPTKFQAHHPAQTSAPDYAGEFIDTRNAPHITGATFEYPQCAQANSVKLPVDIIPGFLGVNSDALLELTK